MKKPPLYDPPYVAVIFSSKKKVYDPEFSTVADYLDELVTSQPGYLGHETVGDDPSITVSYWRDMDAVKAWRQKQVHDAAIRKSQNEWYDYYTVRVAVVEREYHWVDGE